MARIWIHREGEPPRSHPIGENLIVGRGEACGLVLADDSVSTDHAEIVRRGSRYFISDLSSLNGTIVNGRTIDRRTRLNSNDVVQVGPFRLELDLPAEKSTRLRPAMTVELSEEERKVARALVAPYRNRDTFAGRPASNAEIAAELHMSESTVKRRVDSLALRLKLAEVPPGDRRHLIADRVMALGLDQG